MVKQNTMHDSKVQVNDPKSIGVTIKKTQDMPEWYSQVCLKAEIADYSPIKGCMVIRPYGYAIWQKIQEYFDSRIKKIGVQNAYFPLFIPESFFRKEAEHAEGFKPEVAWVEKKDEAEEKYALRPTSETIMYDAYSRWIRSWRDLPLRINQWCNIIRWEVKDVKLFLRSREFLWQEGHCVYATRDECDKETFFILDEYEKLSRELLAVPVIKGTKTSKEKFPGAEFTTTIESLMPDGKSLQMGTSHTLSQGFARSFDIKFLGKDEQYHLPWQNSWGISTRLIGAVVLMHGDDKGLVLPPMIAPIHAVIVPIFFEKSKEKVMEEGKKLHVQLSKNFSVRLDDRDEYSAGYKFNEWEMKGVPIRLEIGPKDIENRQVVLVRRDTGGKESVPLNMLENKISSVLADIQQSLYERAGGFIKAHTVHVGNMDELKQAIEGKNWAIGSFCEEEACETDIKEKTAGITTRCIPHGVDHEPGKCINCGNEAKVSVYFARAY